ncbi:MAG TPA: bifunctional hydroxymethylpyrimidine kinase/phosphomethylpyrimidine kinase [Gemmatimonadales bacterium]|nr:bifunctional hydroxymethylpyrimidine kinase/phosphomethylpyrimidine kinase [Gemmatimonadales bacterium]
MTGTPPIALTIAGSDSGGGAGIQADLKTFHQFGVFGTSVITAVTAQNTVDVRQVILVDAAMVRAQLAAVADDLPPAAVKTGMLGSAEITTLVADVIAARGWHHYVLDPVMVSTSGHRLLDAGAEGVIRDRLLPLATLVTPNLDEAEILTGITVRDPAEMDEAGRRLLALGAGAALVKGGHLTGEELVDVLVTKTGITRIRHARIPTTSTHGTGCTLSAAIAAGLALGWALDAAITTGLDFVSRAIAAAPGLGSGHGPVSHFVAVNGER